MWRRRSWTGILSGSVAVLLFGASLAGIAAAGDGYATALASNAEVQPDAGVGTTTTLLDGTYTTPAGVYLVEGRTWQDGTTGGTVVLVVDSTTLDSVATHFQGGYRLLSAVVTLTAASHQFRLRFVDDDSGANPTFGLSGDGRFGRQLTVSQVGDGDVSGTGGSGVPGSAGAVGASGVAGSPGASGAPCATAGTECPVEIVEFTGAAADTLNGLTFAIVIGLGVVILLLGIAAMRVVAR